MTVTSDLGCMRFYFTSHPGLATRKTFGGTGISCTDLVVTSTISPLYSRGSVRTFRRRSSSIASHLHSSLLRPTMAKCPPSFKNSLNQATVEHYVERPIPSRFSTLFSTAFFSLVLSRFRQPPNVASVATDLKERCLIRGPD